MSRIDPGTGATRVAIYPSDSQLDQSDQVVAVVRGTLAGADPGVIAAAGDYAALDILSDSATAGTYWTFANMAAHAGNGGVIERATITCSVDAFAAKFRLWLFHTAPTTTAVNDNAAFNLTAADRASIVGYLDWAADSVDAGAISVNMIPTTGQLAVPFRCAAGSTSLYGILQTVDAEAGEAAGMTISIELQVRRY